jgi:hypothetical protein
MKIHKNHVGWTPVVPASTEWWRTNENRVSVESLPIPQQPDNNRQASIVRWMPGQPISRDHASTGLGSSDIPLALPRITIADFQPDVST